FSGAVTGSISDGQTLDRDIAPGSYTVTEALKSGWDLSGISCDDDDSTVDTAARSATFVVSAGETVECTFSNRQQRILPGDIWIDTDARWCIPPSLWKLVATEPCA